MTRPHRVGVTVASGSHPFEFSVACEVFGLDRPELDLQPYELLVAAVDDEPIDVGHFQVVAPHRLDALDDVDTIIVPSAPHAGATTAPALGDALRRAHARGARVVSFCSGAFALAEAGILDGRAAATHWMFADELRARFPRVDVRSDVLYVDDGSVLTSAGTAAAIDLSLHIVARDHGAAVANSIARRMVVPPHRDGGQAQFVDTPTATADANRLADTLAWALEHLDDPLAVVDLARHAQLSPRTFARRCQEVTGTTPLRWLSHQRVRVAQELLEASDLPIDVVAQRCGLGTAANLRLHLRRVLGVTPTAYRLTFAR